MKIIHWLFLTHRYLGVALGLLMVMWCLSGVVMMYVSYPELPEAQRLRALEPIDWQGCRQIDDRVLDSDAKIGTLQVEMLSGAPVLRIRMQTGARQLIDLRSGGLIERVSSDQARGAALPYAERPAKITDLESIADDQWTVSGSFAKDRPLFRFAFDDPAKTRLYISSTSGKAVQFTSQRQRFWNWLGAIPHWLYLTPLRRDVNAWSQTVIWSSLLGCFLTLTGLYIGWRQLGRGGKWSPYRGFTAWHHIPGLIFGMFVLTWVASGLASMNPWGFLDSAGIGAERGRLNGALPSGAEVNTALQALAAAPLARDIVSIDAAPFDGTLYFIAFSADGARRRLDANGAAAPLPDPSRIAKTLAGPDPVSTQLITEEDDYYVGHHDEAVRLPVYRLILNNEQYTRYYIDPVSAEIVKKVDASSRWYRWLHEGPHRLDFLSSLRAAPFRTLVMLPLLLGAAGVCGTGAYLGLRRLKRDLTFR